MRDEHTRAAAHWSSQTHSGLKVRWWQSDYIVRHINRRVCGEAIPGASAGAYRLLAERGPFKRAVSIGCGEGDKESRLLQSGTVGHFDLYELSADRVERGRAKLARLGLADRATFHVADGIATAAGPFDLVHWNNALHHMLDTAEAVKWSRDVLRGGGIFFMDDYVGPNRLQWTPAMIEAGTAFRSRLPDRFLVNPRAPDALLRRKVKRADLATLMRNDPTEAADSESILPAIARVFPNARTMLTGGVIYHAALNDVLHNINEVEDRHWLDQALALDDACIDAGLTHYAVAITGRS
jgi:SAM-dependent methyltransferase